MANLLFAVVCLLWGSSFILMKRAAREFNPWQIGSWRLLGGAITLGLIIWVMRRPWPFRKGDIFPLLVLCVVGYVIPFVVQPHFIGEAGNSALMGMIVSLTPLMVIGVSIPMLHEYPTRNQLIGVVGGLLFMLLLLGDSLRAIEKLDTLDVLLALTVPLCYAIAYTYIRLKFEYISSLVLACVSLTIGAAILMPVAILTPSPESDLTLHPASPMTSMIALGLLGIFCTGIATFLFYWILKQHGPLQAGMVSYVIPVMAILWGWVDGEVISLYQLVAIAGIMAMVALVRWRAETTPTM